MSFDPYYEWLGIPPDEQPPDFYRLLGIRRFEPNIVVIENAAERQMLLLKTRQNGPHSEVTQRLMNEVSSARICLLNSQRKSQYDTKLQERLFSETQSGDVAEMLRPLPLDEFTELDSSASKDRLHHPLLPPPRTARGSKAPVRFPRSGFRPSAELASVLAQFRLPVAVIGGFALTGVVMIALLGLFPDNTANDGPSQNRSASSTVIAGAEETGNGTAPESKRNTRNLPPPQPPAPVVTQEKPGESQQSGRIADNQYSRVPETGAVAGQPSAFPESVPPVAFDVNSTNKPASGDSQELLRRADIDRQRDSVEEVATVTDEDARPKLDHQGLDTDAGPDAEAHAPPNQRGTGRRQARGSGGQPGASNSSSAGLPPAFPRLPREFDLSAAIAASGPERLCVGELPTPADADWTVVLEDYSSPEDAPQFSIGAKSTVGNSLQWPVLTLPSSGDSSPTKSATLEQPSDAALFARIEAGPNGLILRFSESLNPQLIERFCLCALTIRNDSAQHFIQLRPSERFPPVTVKFDDNKQSVPLDNMGAVAMLSPDRLMLEILRVDMGQLQPPDASGLQATLNKELTVTLDSQLQCELGIRLSENDGLFTIMVMPRYIVNDRRQPLVAAEVAKDLSRAMSQLAKNRKELLVARDNFQALSAELRQLRASTPGSASEAAVLHNRAVQVEQMGSSIRSKVRRLTEVGPKLVGTIEQLERVQKLIDKASGTCTVQFRMVAKGESGDLVLLQAISSN